MKILQKLIHFYQGLRYFLGPKFYVGRNYEIKTFDEAKKLITKKWSTVITKFVDGSEYKIKM